MDLWVELIANVGFPIAVAAWLLIRIEPAIKQMNESLILLTAYVKAQGKPNNADVIEIRNRVKGG